MLSVFLELVRLVAVYCLVYYYRIIDMVFIWITRSLRPAEHPGVVVEPILIPSRQGGRFIKAFRYMPVEEYGKGPLPVHLNWHASGYVLKRLGLDRYFCYQLCHRLGCIVLDCDYSKGPETLFPRAYEDAEDAVRHVFAHPDHYDTSRVTLGGSSAGGSLALSLAAAFGREKIRGVISVYPVTEWGPFSELSKHKKAVSKDVASGLIVTKLMFWAFYNAHLASVRDLKDPRVSCIYNDVSRLPDHILFACGDADVLFLDSQRFFDKIQREGTEAQRVNTSLMILKNEAHEFNNQPMRKSTLEKRDAMYSAAVDKIRASWGA